MNTQRPRPRVAIVGSGPAGFGVLTGLLEHAPHADVTLFDHGSAPEQPLLPPGDASTHVQPLYDEIYRSIWQSQRRVFPPPKTHFGRTLPKHRIEGKERIFRSEALGGLSNFWGATCLPFTQRELRNWPLQRESLAPHYRSVAERIGISGRHDVLNEYFGDDYVNRPPMQTTATVQHLERVVNEHSDVNDPWRVVAGINRCAVETRRKATNHCIACGECLAGCVRDSIFSSRQQFAAQIATGNIRHVKAKVRSIDAAARTLHVLQEEQATETGSFHRIYLAAGCPNSTEIVMRSFGLTRVSAMADNAVYVFPILYLGRGDGSAANYLSLTNSILGLLPQQPGLEFAQAQVYTNFDYMWRYNLPPGLWPLARSLVRWSRDRLLWGRLYMPGAASQSYGLEMREDSLQFNYAQAADVAAAKRAMGFVRKTLNHGGFYVPPAPLVHQKSNTHYASTLPYGGTHLDVAADGQIAPGVYLCDSSVFPDLPAVSLTFTIMANAHRTAMESL
ncbi:MAG: hypothetical protein ABIT36_09320 [Steroidobacteraceae bacterium]